jgi:hypothetical protein
MNKQRRKRLNRMKRTEIRRGTEPLENRVLPGGFLDLLAGAAFASAFDLLPEEQLVPEEIESESKAFSALEYSARSTLLAGLSFPEIDLTEEDLTRSVATDDEDFSYNVDSPSTTDTLMANSLVDTFFASNQFADTPVSQIAPPSRPTTTPSPSFSSPISQLGAGVGSGSGQGYNVTGAELPQSNVGSSSLAAPPLPAWMMGEGEGDGGASASGSASGAGSSSGSASGGASGMEVTYGSYLCGENAQEPHKEEPRNVPAGPGAAVTDLDGIKAPNGEADIPWITPDTPSNSIFVVNNPVPSDGFGDDSALGNITIIGYRQYYEYGIATGGMKDNPNPTSEISFTFNHSFQQEAGSIGTVSSTSTIQASVEAKGASIGASIESTASKTATFTATTTTSTSTEYKIRQCSVLTVYDSYLVTEVNYWWRYYEDTLFTGPDPSPSGFTSQSGFAVATSRIYMGTADAIEMNSVFREVFVGGSFSGYEIVEDANGIRMTEGSYPSPPLMF